MKLITWNIQWGLGCDGRVDLGRIAHETRRLCDADVICYQEVTSGFDDLKGSDGSDQFAALAALFPGYEAVAFAPVDMPGARGRRLFGNMILTRLPLGQVMRHAMPWDTDGVECMARGCIELVVEAQSGPLRIMTTHLEWSSAALRAPQIEYLRDIQRRAARRVSSPPVAGKGPYRTRPGSVEAILTGDFNMKPDDSLIERMQAPADEPGIPRFIDAWRLAHGDASHPPSMCLNDQVDGPPRCLDYIFVTEGLANRIASLVYDQTSDASDHQPVIIDLRW